MPFILLIFGIAIGGYALYKFLRSSTKEEAQKALLSLAIGLCLVLIFAMILIGKLPIAAILTAIMIPLVSKLYRLFNNGSDSE